MSRTAWKQRERDVAAMVGGRRHPANTGGKVDVQAERLIIQVKERKTLSLAQIERLAVEINEEGRRRGLGERAELWLKRSAGRGQATPWLVVTLAPREARRVLYPALYAALSEGEMKDRARLAPETDRQA